MSKFDEFIDEFVFMAKSAAGAASKKTGEVMETGKLKYQIKQAEWDIERCYAKLGAIYYESKRSPEDFTDAIHMATGEIDDLKRKIDRLEEDLRTFKKVQKCPKCDKENDLNAAFCMRCGSPLEGAPIESEAPADEPQEGAKAENNDDEIDF